MMITEKAYKALKYVEKHSRFAPKYFAKYMWPDSPGWSVICSVGRGSTPGAQMPQAGGAFLGRLRRRGLINFRPVMGDPRREWYLTDEGKAAIEKYEAGQGDRDG